jgi:ribosomal protein S21
MEFRRLSRLESSMQVEVRGDDIESAIRYLKKIAKKDGIHQEVKRREQSPNKTDRRKAKAQIAFKRRREAERKRTLGRSRW